MKFKIVRKIGGLPGDDPAMPVGEVKFFGNHTSEYYGFWRITDRQPCTEHPGENWIVWTLTRGFWLKFRTWIKRVFK